MTRQVANQIAEALAVGAEKHRQAKSRSHSMNKSLAALFASLFTLSAFGENPVTPGAPNAIEGQPVMYFGVKSCGKSVMWVLLTNGHLFRIDDEHSPADKQAFMKQLAGVNGDIVEIPCAAIV